MGETVVVKYMGSRIERYCYRHVDRETWKTGDTRGSGRGHKAELTGLQKRAPK